MRMEYVLLPKQNRFSIITHLSTDLNNFCHKIIGQSAHIFGLLGERLQLFKSFESDAVYRTDTHVYAQCP